MLTTHGSADYSRSTDLKREFERLLLGAQDGHAALVEVMRVLLGGDVEVHGENEVGAREVQVDGQRDLRREETA